MKKIKVSEATGPVLDWMVAKAVGIKCSIMTQRDFEQQPYVPRKWVQIWDQEVVDYVSYEPSIDWSQGGPIIEREIYQLLRCQSGSRGPVYWEAARGFEDDADHVVMFGPTLLTAAMRCFVASRLGDEVEVPEELA